MSWALASTDVSSCSSLAAAYDVTQKRSIQLLSQLPCAPSEARVDCPASTACAGLGPSSNPQPAMPILGED
jgi:hypothetical protein